VVKAGEILAAMLLTWHNLKFYQNLMQELRQAIFESRVEALALRYKAGENPTSKGESCP
jgi:queuine tRNA-ribosyltransferase